MARILISAGEASGDIHAAAVTRELKNIAPDTEVFGMGGDCLREAGGEVLFDIKEHGVMGFVEIVCKLPALFKLKKAFAKVIEERKPDCLVVVDYPGFNMRLAKLAKAKGIPVVSYISPSAWAWHKSRAKSVAQIVNKVAALGALGLVSGDDFVFLAHIVLLLIVNYCKNIILLYRLHTKNARLPFYISSLSAGICRDRAALLKRRSPVSSRTTVMPSGKRKGAFSRGSSISMTAQLGQKG